MVELNIYHLVNQLEGKQGRRISDNEIARAINVHRHTVSSVRKGREETLISKLVDYFRSNGLDISPGDLFVVTERTPGE